MLTRVLTECSLGAHYSSCWAASRLGITFVGQCSDCKRTFLFFSNSWQTDHKLVSLGLAVGCDQDCLNEAQGTTKGCDHICSACNLSKIAFGSYFLTKHVSFCSVLLCAVFFHTLLYSIRLQSRALNAKLIKYRQRIVALLSSCPVFRCCACHIPFVCIYATLQQQTNCCHCCRARGTAIV